LGDTFYFGNRIDGLKSWDPIAGVALASASLKLVDLATHKSRVFAIGDDGSERTLFISKFNDGGDYTLVVNPADTDPAQIVIGGSIDEPLVALYSSFKGKLMWFKKTSFGAVLGSGRSSFEISTYSDGIGTSYPRSIQDCDGFLRWYGSPRSVWEFDGTNLSPENRISRNNDDFFKLIIQGDGNDKQWVQTSQSDFESGSVFGDLSTTDSKGNLVFSTGTLIDDFSDGNFSSNPAWTEVSSGTFFVTRGTWAVVNGEITTSTDGVDTLAMLSLNQNESTGTWIF